MMDNARRYSAQDEFEKTIKKYLRQGREKLFTDLAGTREAMKMIASDKTRNFMQTMDKGLDKTERDFLNALIVSSMYQSFCYGYGIGKMEAATNSRIYL